MVDRIVALAIFFLLAAVILLAVKGSIVNRYLFTLARQFRLHHFVSLAVFALVLVHITIAFWRDWPDSPGLYLNSADLATLAGWAAAGLFATVIATSWIAALGWKRWYVLHLLSLPALGISAYHGLAYAAARSVDTGILVALLTLIAILLLQIFSERLGSGHSVSFQVIENRAVAAGIFELHLVAAGSDSTSLPAGSVVYLRFDSTGFSRAWHPFSVASSTRDKDLRLMIKALGHDTGRVGTLAPGSQVQIRGPFREYMPDFSRPQVWIAGGIGIAPFIGYVAGLEAESAQRIELFYFAEQPAELMDLAPYLAQHGTSLVLHTQAHSGKPDLTQLLKLAHELSQAQYTICGPHAFLHYTRQGLLDAGIMRGKIHTEEFQPW